MVRTVSRWSIPALATVIVVCGVGACGSSVPARQDSDTRTSPASVTAASSPRPYRLYTHCGIDEARIGSRYFTAVHPLSDGSGNPPPGWGNPYEQGKMTVVSSTVAVFRDRAGHEVRFRLRRGATRFQHLCS
jgi:hypothetical protein